MACRAVPVLLSVALLAATAARAQEPLTYQEQSTLNFAFATRLGSGVYDVNGRSVQIYRLPFSWTPVHEEPGQVGLRLRLPVTIGFYDFEPRDVVESGLPESLDTASFVPGIEARIPVRANWKIFPYVEAGLAADRQGEARATVASLGARSVADFAPGAGRWRLALGSELVYSGVDGEEESAGDDFALLQACLEARHGLGFAVGGREADAAIYASYDLFYSDPSFPIEHQDHSRLDGQAEVGVTFGRTEPPRIWGLELPRLGLGYRFGDGLSVLRLVIGIPAPALER